MHKIEIENEYNGFKYVVLMTDMGHRCGYVGVDKEHVLYGKDYSDKIPCLKRMDVENSEIGKRGIIPLLCMDADDEYLRPDCYFNVHGGITYADGKDDYPIKSELWWYGFDCAHCDDGKDLGLAFEYGLIDEKRMNSLQEIEDMYPSIKGTMRSLEYVEQECKNLVKQIMNLGV